MKLSLQAIEFDISSTLQVSALELARLPHMCIDKEIPSIIYIHQIGLFTLSCCHDYNSFGAITLSKRKKKEALELHRCSAFILITADAHLDPGNASFFR